MAEEGKEKLYKGKRMIYHTSLDEKTNRPAEYIVAGTPGEPSIVGGAMLNYQGLAGKIVKGAKEGYDFIELDLWNDAEILEPHLAERIKHLRATHKIDIGIHLRINLDLTSALGPIWDVNHKSLVTGVLGATEVVKANFILMHSAATPILEFGEAAARTAPSTLVTPWKDNLAAFIESPLCYDHQTRKRILENGLVPRLKWNVYSANKKNIVDKEKVEKYDVLLKPRCKEKEKEPTLKDWAISKFVKDIWFPGTIPQAEVMVAIKDVETMREVFDGFDKALSIFNKWFRRYEGRWRVLIEKKIDNILNPVINILKKNVPEVGNITKEQLKDPQYFKQLQDSIKAAIEQEKNEDKKEKLKNAFDTLNKYNNEFFEGFYKEYYFYFYVLEKERTGTDTQSFFYEHLEQIMDLFKKSLGISTKDEKGKSVLSNYPFITDENDIIDLKNDINILEDIIDKNYIKIILYYKRYSVAENFSYWVQKGSEGEEQIAYRTIAKWMYVIKDPLFEKIVIGDKEVNKWWNENKEEVKKHKSELFGEFKGSDEQNKIDFLDPDNIISYTSLKGGVIDIPLRKMVAAISAKYIQGHLDRPMGTDKNLYLENSKPEEAYFKASMDRQLKSMRINPDGGNNPENMKCIYQYMYDEGVHFYIETQDVLQEEWRGKVRIMSLTDHIEIIKAFSDHYGFDNVSYTMDFEHLTSNLLNPRQQIEQLDKGDAKYLSMVHINPPSSVQGLHKILKKMSFDTEYIYGWLYKLKSLGMSGAYFVWEMGKDTGGGTYEAPLALRALAGELKKGTKPEDLPEEFFGIDANFRAMQVQAIKAHGLDPLRDMFFFKPEDHTFIGQMARAANAEIADKERLR